MKHDKPAKRLIELGHEEAKLTRALMRVQAERCAILRECECDAETSPEVTAMASAPKDDGGK